MSKMDGLRAMREARYEQAAGAAKKAAPRRPAPVAPALTPEVDADSPATQRLCGHRAIGGRTCTREHGHAAKSHRYS
ncbi:hypothetical protein [Nocardioides sp.]|uniref:hypothetical protein n=1 Tax=Nocardioides sp. TaxID=35761 RepID=UPI003D0E908D